MSESLTQQSHAYISPRGAQVSNKGLSGVPAVTPYKAPLPPHPGFLGFQK